jgi:hypothetical protein
MKRENNTTFMEKSDMLRMNQLVRGIIDFNAFVNWYTVLTVEEQSTLIGALCHCAYQAGVTDAIYTEVSEKSGLSEDDEMIVMFKKVRNRDGVNVGGFVKWVSGVTPAVRLKALKWFIYLFGVAEQRLLESEDLEKCNHWWHRDIKNPVVAESILNDPEFYRTAPRDDKRPL